MGKHKLFSVRNFFTLISVALVIVVIYLNWSDIIGTFEHLNEANLFVLLLLIPEQLYMYYACGQIFFSYLRQKYHQKFSKKEQVRVATELNFVTRAVPAGGIGGLAYLTYRFKPYGITAGQSSFLYIFRYVITTVVNYFQALVAVVVLAVLHQIPPEAMWVIWVAFLMNLGMFVALSLIIFVASSKKRIGFFAKLVVKVANGFMRVVTFGKVKCLTRCNKVEDYFMDIHESVKIVKQDKKVLKKPTLWGLAYSLLEVGAYWVVAISLGRPELLPVIMIGEAIGSVFDGIVPYGLYELGMAGVMIALGADEGVTLIIVMMTRVLTLLFTIITGWLPYYRVIQGKKDEAVNGGDA
ncbi:MAG: lysylphosphatidylglycerol synthase domain-containing protein [Candidatus Saccharibacteria bacterium]|nr:lysylphosphatidylglycerol synthase domain-containing protein [Candidatus Saccharibacteria bacterium]